MTADTQDDCRRAFEEWYSTGWHFPKSVERHGDSYRLAQANAAWSTWQAAWNTRAPSRPSAAGDVVERVAEAIQLEDAECFPTLNLKKRDYAMRLAKAAIAAMPVTPLNVEELITQIEGLFEFVDPDNGDGYTTVIDAEAATALIRKWAEGGKL